MQCGHRAAQSRLPDRLTNPSDEDPLSPVSTCPAEIFIIVGWMRLPMESQGNPKSPMENLTKYRLALGAFMLGLILSGIRLPAGVGDSIAGHLARHCPITPARALHNTKLEHRQPEAAVDAAPK